ncbi:DUF7342 family protein [Halarchaeum acidiphilum]
MRTTYDPVSAATVAEHALTSEQTARKHLRSLVEHGYVAETAPQTRRARCTDGPRTRSRSNRRGGSSTRRTLTRSRRAS